MNQEWGSNTNIGIELGEVGRHLLAIVGPSGSGKTTIAVAVTELCTEAFIVPIYTTRLQRADDSHGYYRHISEIEFSALDQANRFFIARRKPLPNYGWMLDDVAKAVQSSLIAILPFRHGGARFLLNVVPFMLMVFIEPALDSSSLYTTGRIRPDTEGDVQSVIQQNRQIRSIAMAKGWPTLTIQNKFSGAEEVHRYALAIMDLAQGRV